MSSHLNLPLNQILLGDALKVLKSLPDSSIDCCFTSPVYFQMCDYECEDQYGLEPTIAEYLLNISKVFSEVYRVLKDGSCCWIVIGDTMNNYSPIRAKGQRRKLNEYRHRRPKQAGYQEKESLSIPHQVVAQLRSDGWLHRQTFIWDKGESGGVANSDTAPLTHENVLQMGKWSKRSRPYLRCHPLRSTVVRFSATSDPVHPCPFPVPLASYFIEASTVAGETVIDPFIGSGSTAIAATRLNRNFIGIELNPDYRDIAISRLTLPASLEVEKMTDKNKESLAWWTAQLAKLESKLAETQHEVSVAKNYIRIYSENPHPLVGGECQLGSMSIEQVTEAG